MSGKNQFFPSFSTAIRALYKLGQGDEALEPIVKFNRSGEPVGRLQDDDVVIFYNLRGEREIELTLSLTERNFNSFPRSRFPRLHFITLVDYSSELKVKVAFPAEGKLRNTLVEVVGRSGLRVIKIAESEKEPHIGFFLNGKTKEIFPGEERVIFPSPSVSSYEMEPAMKSEEITNEVINQVNKEIHNLIIANLANVDVVGHCENKESVIQAIEKVDECLGKIYRACRKKKVCLIVTADHGTVEEWLYPDGTINTGHTQNPVPFILGDFSCQWPEGYKLRTKGELADVAPTILELLGLVQPQEMTGRSLIISNKGLEKVGASLKAQDKKADEARSQSLSPFLGQACRVVLLILDGWGLRNDDYGNLIAASSTPNFDLLWNSLPHSLLQASGDAVGLPERAVGNSEAGHLHLGAGRRLFLDRVRIDRSLADGSFFQNKVLGEAMKTALVSGRALHLMGIVSQYSSHGTIRHLFALLEMAKNFGLQEVYLHAFVGRRGEKPESGVYYIEKVEEKAKELNCGQLVTLMGRYWALDREENWDRVERAYLALVEGQGYRVCPDIS